MRFNNFLLFLVGILIVLVTTQCFSSTSSKRLGDRPARHALQMSALDERELAKIFGRLADKMILLDVPGAGTPEMANCCHGGCDNCEYSHVFDQMNAGRAKWVPSYTYRQLIDGREHSSPWLKVFKNELEVTRDEFITRLIDLPYQMNMGSLSVPADEVPKREAVDQFFDALSSGRESISKEKLEEVLPAKVKDKHGVVWNAFKKAFVATKTTTAQ